ncbi:hypothetical protein CVT24_007495 [Panaeolus cyanescens]|uniref:Anaphase-promoting complex subunit 5 n=1 Tax=Panaeolus cyanescens TaxID=181874 RepID=A0A409YL30_9AGAR|nr:hypothetical protein CVT24_007495 [Panaeolus cyanescens]
MEEESPSNDHVIRPHHISILSILMVAFKDLEIKKFPNDYALHIYRVLLSEIAQVAEPRSHKELLHTICSGPRSQGSESFDFKAAINSIHTDITTADRMGNFLQNIRCLLIDKSPSEPARFFRRSVFGYFCRRSYFSFLKLSFSGLVKLCVDYQHWVAGDSTAGYDNPDKELLIYDKLVYKTQVDKKNWAKPEAYGQWTKAELVGDHALAVDHLRRFFEQHFSDDNKSSHREHALLNVVRMHYVQGEFGAARRLLIEAVDAARTSGDKLILHHCTSLLQRLPPLERDSRPSLLEIQSETHPLEILFDVSKLLNERNQQPMSAAFQKIFQAVGLYDQWLSEVAKTPVNENYQWSQHAVQSIAWTQTGCDRLSSIEEDIVIAFSFPSPFVMDRLSAIINKAYKHARQGRYEEALCLLMEPSTWTPLGVNECAHWASQIWHILSLRATRRGQIRAFRAFLLERVPIDGFNPREYLFDMRWDTMSTIKESLFQVIQARDQDQAASSIDHLLSALWYSEFLCRFNLYRTSIILLADIGLEFNLSKRSRRILEEIMPQVINGDDLEQRAVAYFVLARCIIVAEESNASALQQALHYLQIAEEDFQKLEMYRSTKEVQYLLSVVYHNLGLENERDKAALRHENTEKQERDAEAHLDCAYIQEIYDTIALIGAAVATR